ncbi:MAG: YsnF/AvaK domain-containing protein [Rhodobacteraceae bacterium]|nr:YsnF/AvaK domain-containing protein [Paracoccaceae bacterium]
MPDHDRETLELAEETATFGKRRIETGRVRVRIETEAYETLAAGELEGQTVEVERVARNVYVDAPPEVRTEGDLTIVPILEEVLVVEKRLVLIEEIHIRRVVATDAVEAPVTLRRQRAIVERVDPETDGAPTDPDTQPARNEP